MREIKFRAYDKKEGLMFFMDNPCYSGEYQSWDFGVDFKQKEDEKERLRWCAHSENWEIMQYTGLKDKNGKEIYEEDIVENQHGTRGVYVWNNRREGWDVWYREFPGFETMNEWTVIGNVHDNPKLLN